MTVSFSYAKCEEYIQSLAKGGLVTLPGCTEEETLEVSMSTQKVIVLDFTVTLCLSVNIKRLRSIKGFYFSYFTLFACYNIAKYVSLY